MKINFPLVLLMIVQLKPIDLLAQIPCECDTSTVKLIVNDNTFNRLSKFDTASFDTDDFYKLNKEENRLLWYRDIENIDTTKFTKLWNDYASSNYHASHPDFIRYYENKKDIELAFQFGPNMDLWAYHIFIVKKIGCCYLITRSYFRHARFTYKAYSIITRPQLDTLMFTIQKINQQPLTDKEDFGYKGYFMDNINKKKFFIDFRKETIQEGKDEGESKPEIKDLYQVVEKKIAWTVTYSL